MTHTFLSFYFYRLIFRLTGLVLKTTVLSTLMESPVHSCGFTYYGRRGEYDDREGGCTPNYGS